MLVNIIQSRYKRIISKDNNSIKALNCTQQLKLRAYLFFRPGGVHSSLSFCGGLPPTPPFRLAPSPYSFHSLGGRVRKIREVSFLGRTDGQEFL